MAAIASFGLIAELERTAHARPGRTAPMPRRAGASLRAVTNFEDAAIAEAG